MGVCATTIPHLPSRKNLRKSISELGSAKSKHSDLGAYDLVVYLAESDPVKGTEERE